MTVLQRKAARGFETGPIRKFVVGAALAAAGVAAAFGLSQVFEQDTTSAETGLTAVERNAIAQAQAEGAESIQPVDQALIDRYGPAATMSPAAVEHARGLDVLEEYNTLGAQSMAGANTSQAGPR